MPASAQPRDITLGPDGNLWFTESSANLIGEINPSDPSAGIHNHPGSALSGAEVFGIPSGPGGDLWFTERSNNAIGVLNPANPDAAPTTYTTGITASSRPRGIAAGA